MYPSDRQLQYFYTLTQFIRIIKDFGTREYTKEIISLVVYTGYGGSESSYVFSAMDARFLHTSMNYQRKHVII